MRATSKMLALATVLGTSAIGIIKHHKDVTKHAKSVAHKVAHTKYGKMGVDTYYINNAYSNLKDDQKKLVQFILNKIIPRKHRQHVDSLAYQLDVANYMKALKYTAENNHSQVHASYMAQQMHMPLVIAKNMVYDMTQERLLEHTEAGADYVRQSQVRKNLRILSHYYTPKHLVDPLVFTRILRDLIAYNKYSF